MRRFVLSFSAFLLLAFQAFAQNQQVSGTVTFEDGAPITGVAVVVKGTQTGVVTDVNGRFSIGAPADATLQFSFVGLETQEVAVGSRTTINVTMRQGATSIDDVLITAVGIQRAERSLGYSVSKINPDEGVQKAEPDLLRSLDGKIPGVQISAPSGAAGSATRITIRGNSSFQGSNQPLYVVDGVPYSDAAMTTNYQDTQGGGAYGSGISTLDPNDIESMNVLKGAAAAALYGSRAANGVIVITTKSASKSANSRKGFEVTFNGSYTIEKISDLPDYQNLFGQGSNFRYASANGSWGAPFSELDRIAPYPQIANVYPDWAINTYPDYDGMIPYRAQPNNVEDLFRTGSVWETSVNMQNVTDKGNFSMTLSRMKQESFQPGSDFERYNISVGGNHQLSNGLRFGGTMSWARTIQDGAMYGGNPVNSEYANVNSLSRAFIFPRSFDMQNMPYTAPDGSNLLGNLTGQANDPRWAWENDTNHTVADRMVATINLGYDFTDWLTATYTLGINDLKTDRRSVINIGSTGWGGRGHIYTDNYNVQELESTLLLNFNHNITPDIGFNAYAGHNFNQYTTDRKRIEGRYMIEQNIFSVGNTESQTATENYSRTRLWGIFADATFDYKQWVFLNISGRYDFSSTLPDGARDYFYPAVSASFVFTDAFDLRSNVLEFGKIRASWAQVGNAAQAYYVNGTYDTGRPYLGNPLMEYPATSYDENLKPEFTTEIEVGLEMAFFKNRLGFDLSLYNRNTTDQIAPLATAPSSGITTYWTNFGKMNNRGIELGVTAVPVLTSGFKWDIYGTYTLNKSEVKELYPGYDELRVLGTNFDTPRAVLRVGEPYGILMGSKIMRDEHGNPLVDPASGFYINDPETGFIGNPNPKYKMSLTNNFSYKGITLSVMMDFQKGGCVYTSYIPDLLGRGVTQDTENRYGSRIFPGVLGDPRTGTALKDANGNSIKNTVTVTESDLYFAASGYSAFAVNSANEMNTYDATVFRIRELSLGWDLPRKWLAKTFIGSANVSFVGRNLFFYAPNVPKHTNWDPVASSLGDGNVQGIDHGNTPSSKRYGFNLRFTF